jgi:sporulation protein YlmC with PRC-barrel domain
MMRASELQGKRVRRENGEVLGRVYEIRLHHSRVTALICGARGFLQRLTGAVSGHRVPWEQVRKITPSEIVIADGGSRAVKRRKRRSARRK